MEIIQEIGAYAGLAAILGLALLSALYFSQARDVKRLREWAGRAPDRAPGDAVPRRVTAQPVPKPGQQLPGRPVPPPVPRPPGAEAGGVGRPAVAQSATGAAPATAAGPAMATPAAKAVAPSTEEASREADDQDQGEGAPREPASDQATAGPPETDEGVAAVPGAPEADETQPGDALPDDAQQDEARLDGADEEPGAEGEPPVETGESAPPATVHQQTDEWDPVEGGEWDPEDEHSDYELTEPDDDPEPTPLPTVRPPVPPRPYATSRAPVRSPAASRSSREGPGSSKILPPYAEARPGTSPPGGRRMPLLVLGGLVGLAVLVFGILQLTGGDETTPSSDRGGTQQAGGDAPGDALPPIDPSSVTVAVLNGTTAPGLAATLGDTIAGHGYELGTVTNNFDQERAESVVLYAPDAEREATDVGRRLNIAQREPIDPDSQALAGDATVVVVAGADQTQ